MLPESAVSKLDEVQLVSADAKARFAAVGPAIWRACFLRAWKDRFGGISEIGVMGIVTAESSVAMTFDAAPNLPATMVIEATERPSKPSPLPYELVGSRDPVLDRPYVIKHVLNSRSCAVLFGESGTGKSHLAIEMAMAIARGQDFFGHPTCLGSVLYLAGEGADGLQNRIFVSSRNESTQVPIPVAIVKKTVNLDLVTALDALHIVETVRSVQQETGRECRLVVIDTLARSISGDENSSQDMGRFIKACEHIRDVTGACVLVIHHTGKDSSRGARGHSSLRAAMDTELLVEGRKNPRTLTVTKQRDLAIAKPIRFELESIVIGQDTDGEQVTACVVRERDSPPSPLPHLGGGQALLLRELGRLQQSRSEPIVWTLHNLRAIGRGLSMHRNTARDAVSGLVRKQLLELAGDGFQLASWTARIDRRRTICTDSPSEDTHEPHEGSKDPVRSVRVTASDPRGLS